MMVRVEARPDGVLCSSESRHRIRSVAGHGRSRAASRHHHRSGCHSIPESSRPSAIFCLSLLIIHTINSTLRPLGPSLPGDVWIGSHIEGRFCSTVLPVHTSLALSQCFAMGSWTIEACVSHILTTYFGLLMLCWLWNVVLIRKRRFLSLNGARRGALLLVLLGWGTRHLISMEL